VSLGFGVTRGERWTVSVPSWRRDCSHQADLIEDVARIAGYDNLPVVSLPSPGGRAVRGAGHRAAKPRARGAPGGGEPRLSRSDHLVLLPHMIRLICLAAWETGLFWKIRSARNWT
jgi:hypothetical protein